MDDRIAHCGISTDYKKFFILRYKHDSTKLSFAKDAEIGGGIIAEVFVDLICAICYQRLWDWCWLLVWMALCSNWQRKRQAQQAKLALTLETTRRR